MSGNFYDPNTPDPQPEAPPEDEIILMAIRQALLGASFMLPCVVTKVNRTRDMVTVQPQIKRTYTDGTITALPEIQNVPVSFLRGADWSVRPPVGVGDLGMAVFCDRSLEEYSVQGGLVDPVDGRYHDLSDAVFVPGLYPFNNPLPDTTDDMIITNGKAVIRVQKAGTFKIQNDQNELIDLMDQLLDTLINKTFTLTMLGAEPFIASTNVLLQQIKDKLETLKGS